MTTPKKKRRRNVRSFAGGSNAVRSRERRERERLADAKHHRAESLARATKLPAAQAIAIYREEKALSQKRNAPIIAERDAQIRATLAREQELRERQQRGGRPRKVT